MHHNQKILNIFLLGIIAIAMTSATTAEAIPTMGEASEGWYSVGEDMTAIYSDSTNKTLELHIYGYTEGIGSVLLDGKTFVAPVSEVTEEGDTYGKTVISLSEESEYPGLDKDQPNYIVFISSAGSETFTADCNLVYQYIYTVSFTSSTGGKTSVSSIEVPKDTAYENDGTTMNFTYMGVTIKSVEAIVTTTGYQFSSWSPSKGTITSDQSIRATFSGGPGPGPGPGPTPTTTYTVTFTAGTGGTVLPTQVTVNSGSAISVSGNVMTIGTGTSARTITATPATGYVLDAWSKTSGTVTSNMTITVTFKQSAQPITKEVPNGAVTLPASVVEALDIKDTTKLVLTIDKVTPTLSNLPSDAVCFSITLKYDGKALTSFPSDIEVLLKYTPPTGTDVTKLKVYYVSDDGKKVENMNASYDSSKKGMTFKVSHLSVFAITQKSIEPVPPSLTSISVKTAPTKVSYTAGDKFDPTGLVLSLKYDDGSSKDLAYKGNESSFGFTPSLDTSLKSTDKTVTITYEGKTTTQSITVAEPAPSGGGDNTMLLIIICVIVVILAIIGVVLFLRRNI